MLRRTIFLVVTALVALAAGALPAGAQQYPPAANFCTISDTTPTPGQGVTLTCGTFLGGATVSFTFFSSPVSLGSATAGADGVVTADLTIPADATLGAHTLTASGESPSGTLTQSITITVVGEGAAGAGTAVGGTTTGPLPRTGADSTWPLVRAGALLLAVGGVVTLAVRRRRSEVPSTV